MHDINRIINNDIDTDEDGSKLEPNPYSEKHKDKADNWRNPQEGEGESVARDELDDEEIQTIINPTPSPDGRPAHRPRRAIPEGEERKRIGLNMGETAFNALAKQAKKKNITPAEHARNIILNHLKM